MNPVDLAIMSSIQGKNYPQMRIEYDANNNAIYVGVGDKGAAASDALWIVEKITYDANNNATLTQSSPDDSIWDNRAALVYS